MLVLKEDFSSILESLLDTEYLAIDTETTGLYSYKEDKLFSIAIADKDKEYYFDFLETLPREFILNFKPLFDSLLTTWFLHNAKFDMHMFNREGLEFKGIVHCTLAQARVEYNAHIKYSLDSCAERIGLKKDDAVEEYITKHKLYEWETIPGKKQRSKIKYYDKVPMHIMHKYAEQDARVTYELGIKQVKNIKEISTTIPTNLNPLTNVMKNERRFTKTCFNIEKRGVLIDKKYCKEASEYEAENMQKAAIEFQKLTGAIFCNSSKTLAPIFKALGEVFPQTEKGNDSFDKNTLDTFSSPAAIAVKEYRKSEKRAGYFFSYLYYADKNGVIHADIKQAGTESGRVSYGNPNFQNVPKRGEDNSPYPVRRAIIPRPAHLLMMADYDAMEYRMMIDYSEEMELVEKVKNGLDVHSACQEMMGLQDRDIAKTMNFLKLYGGGAQKLADALKISLEEAQELSQKYWQKLPKVGSFIKRVSRTAETRGYVINWFGRHCHFPNPKFAYAAPNHLIQGGCADVVKVAMNNIDLFLRNKKSKMIMQIHDELVIEVHEQEQDIIPEIKILMESAYKYKHLPLTCGVDISDKSWSDKKEWLA